MVMKPMQWPLVDPRAALTRWKARESAGARRRMLSTLGLVAALAVIVALAQTSPGHSLMRLTGLTKAPAGYTALSFTNTGGLPATVPEGHVGLDVSFTIHNATQSAATYRWAVRLVHGSKSQSGARGTVTVDAGDAKAENTPVSTVCDSGTLEVIVTLTAPSESIHFRTACGG